MALEDLVVRLAETAAVNDEVVRSNEREFLASAGAPTGAPALVTWKKKNNVIVAKNDSCLLTYLSNPAVNWAIFRLACLRRTNIIVEKSCVIENEFHGRL